VRGKQEGGCKAQAESSAVTHWQCIQEKADIQGESTGAIEASNFNPEHNRKYRYQEIRADHRVRKNM
jgi:hypothetical protein